MPKKKNSKFILDRDAALDSRPCRLPLVGSELKAEKLNLTVELERPIWQRLLGAEKKSRKTFALDEYGREVYELCDGKKSVRNILKIFAQKHRLSVAEAETAVTAFLKTLTTKGIVGIEVKPSSRS